MTALELLQKYKLDEELPINLNKLLENLSIKAYAMDFSSFDPQNEIAGYIKVEGDETIIALNKRDPHVRQRFTLAHEIGHRILHLQNVGSFKQIELRSMNRTYKEIEADQFAAELLMPKHLVLSEHIRMPYPLASSLAKIFNVSVSAMKRRLDAFRLWYFD